MLLGWIMPARTDGLHLHCQPLETIFRGRLYVVNKWLYHLEQPLDMVINAKKMKFESLYCFIAVKFLFDGQTTVKIKERSQIATPLLTKGQVCYFALYSVCHTCPCCIQIEETIFIYKSNASLTVSRHNIYCLEKHYISCASPIEFCSGLFVNGGG